MLNTKLDSPGMMYFVACACPCVYETCSIYSPHTLPSLQASSTHLQSMIRPVFFFLFNHHRNATLYLCHPSPSCVLYCNVPFFGNTNSIVGNRRCRLRAGRRSFRELVVVVVVLPPPAGGFPIRKRNCYGFCPQCRPCLMAHFNGAPILILTSGAISVPSIQHLPCTSCVF